MKVDHSCTNHKGNTVVHQAVEGGFSELVEMLLLVSPSALNCPNRNGDTPLHLAV